MKALCLLILSAIFDCSLAYTIVERPANVDEQQFSYNRIPSGVVQERPPVGFWFQQHPYNLPKPDPQALFELYYLIEVITLYRRVHPRAHRSHLDYLIEELQDEDFQLKIRLELQGMKELNIQQAYGELNLHDYAPFVNDRRQLIPAIHRTLSEIHLGSIKDKELRWTLERLKEESTAMTIKMARKEAEVLKELIESNRKQEKAWTIADILAVVFGKQDESTMKDFEQKYEVVDDGKPVDDGKVEEFWVVFEDDKKEEPPTRVPSTTTSTEPAPFQFVDENYEQFEAKHEVETDVKLESVEQSAEHSSEAKEVEDSDDDEVAEQLAEQENEPKEEVETVEEETVEEVVEQESTIEREEAVDEEEVVESLEQESFDDLNGERRIETDGFEFKDENYERSDVDEEDYERTVPEEDDQSYVEEVVDEEELPDVVPEELQTLEASVESEQEYTGEVEGEPQVQDPSVEEPEPKYTEEVEEEPLDASAKSQEQPEPEYIEELDEDPQSSVEPEEFSEELTEDIPEPAAAKASPDSIIFPDDPQWVEDSVRPVGSSAATSLDSNPPKVAYDSEELPWPMEDVKQGAVTQSVPLWISKGYTAEYEGREVVDDENLAGEVQEANDLESRAEPVGTAQIDPETLQYVAFEILKVVSLLEDNAGFTGLRDQITSEDVDALIERLSMEQFVELINEQGIDKVELINALERLIVEKNLENAGEIVGVLEQWKQGEDGRIMEEDAQEEQVDGVEEVEAGPELKSNDLLEETASVDDGYFSENYGKAGGEEDEIEGRMLEEDEVTTSEEAQEQLVESSDDQEQVEAESEDVQEMKSNSDLGDALEELEAEPELKSNDLLQESVDDGYFSENYVNAGDDEEGIEGRMLEEDDLATSQEAQEQLVEVGSDAKQVEGSDDLEQVEVESEDVQEFKSNVLFEDAPADDGYFSETYGKSADEVEGRTLEEDDQVEESEQIVATPEEAKDAELLVDELEGELKGDVELQVEKKDTLDEIAAEPDSVQELITGDLVEDVELLNDSPELLDDASDLLESISKVEAQEESKNLQPFPEEVTEDTAPLEELLRNVEEKKLQPFPEEVTEDTVPLENRLLVEKKLQPFPEEVTEDTVPLEERLAVEKKLQPFPEEVTEDTVPAEQFDAKKLEPFSEQTLDEATPLEIALDQLEPFPDQIVNETLADPDNPRIVPVNNRPFLEPSSDGSEPLEVARAGTDEGTLEDEDRREEILEDQHPEP